MALMLCCRRPTGDLGHLRADSLHVSQVSFFSQSDAENVESLLKTEVSTLILFVVGKLYNWDIPA